MASPQPASPPPPDDATADDDDDVVAVPVEADEVRVGGKGKVDVFDARTMAPVFQLFPSSHTPQPTGPTAWDDVVADEAAHVALRVVTALMPRTDGGGAPVRGCGRVVRGGPT